MNPARLEKPLPNTIASEWIDVRFALAVIDQSVVTDPTIYPPGFNLLGTGSPRFTDLELVRMVVASIL